MPSYAAFLRGINVGGRHSLPMAGLREVLEGLGHTGVATYVQSGNAVFRAAPRAGGEHRIATAIEDALEQRFGFRPAVVLRTHSELAALAARHPFLEQGRDPAKLVVFFAATAPDEAKAAAMRPSPPDEFAVDGREVFAWFPHGMGRSKLVVDVGVPVTARNWRTVTRVAEMLAAIGG